MAPNHDAKVPFGIEIPQGNRKIIILRHKLCLKIQDGGIGKPVRPMAQKTGMKHVFKLILGH